MLAIGFFGIMEHALIPQNSHRFSWGNAGIPLLPPFTYIIEQNIDISQGVNFALASSRILDETGRNLGEGISFRHQGNNDYINNYLMPEFYGTSFVYNPNKFADILVENYKKYILDVGKIMASKAFNGPPSACYPINVVQMAQKHLPSSQNNASIVV
ncbi:GDSL Lipase/Acylhydrolase superfamily protein [Trifolium repens]|nr:GDSL Lipase/Acylhydrolase superfamily protein [Trifolium repens]